jgi:hypothetical protein
LDRSAQSLENLYLVPGNTAWICQEFFPRLINCYIW